VDDLATKQDLENMKREILEGVAELVRDSQTEILKAFFPFQESVSVRFRKIEADSSNLNVSLTERMGVLERRLHEIEKKLLLNPPA
jgi:hypothetical protein